MQNIKLQSRQRHAESNALSYKLQIDVVGVHSINAERDRFKQCGVSERPYKCFAAVNPRKKARTPLPAQLLLPQKREVFLIECYLLHYCIGSGNIYSAHSIRN